MDNPLPYGTLYVVASPIGNLADLTPRAADTLRAVRLVAAEDTRRSRKLLNHAGAEVPCISVHAHSDARRLQQVIERLRGGDDVALLTDAGTPAISDPGGHLVALAHEAGIRVVPVAGASAVATALSAAGLPADRYTFLGFLPRKGPARREYLGQIAASPVTVVLFEAPNRLAALLGELSEACGGDRSVVVARELTKLHEDIRSGTMSEIRGYYEGRTVKGEITLVIGPGVTTETAPDPESLRARARELLAGGTTRRDAAGVLAAETHISRNAAYDVITTL